MSSVLASFSSRLSRWRDQLAGTSDQPASIQQNTSSSDAATSSPASWWADDLFEESPSPMPFTRSRSSLSVFEKILQGAPAQRVHEGPHTLAFLDKYAWRAGHTLVIPKEKAVTTDQMTPQSSAAVWGVLPLIS